MLNELYTSIKIYIFLSRQKGRGTVEKRHMVVRCWKKEKLEIQEVCFPSLVLTLFLQTTFLNFLPLTIAFPSTFISNPHYLIAPVSLSYTIL